MTQYARPNSDIQTANWTKSTGATFYGCIDEATYDDGDYIYSNAGQTSQIQMGLSPVTDPVSSINHTIRFRAKSEGSATPEKITAYLYEGTTLRASYQTGNLTRGTYNEFSYTLSAAEADAIGNYGNLRLYFTPSSGIGSSDSVYVSWAQFEVPDAAQVYQKSFAITETSLVAQLKRQRRSIILTEASSVTASLRLVYAILAAITVLASLSTQKRQARLVGLQEATAIQVAKRQGRLVSVTAASQISLARRARRLIGIVESSSVTVALGKFYRITASIISSASLSVQKAQSRLVAIQESSLVQVLRTQKRQLAVTEASTVTIAKIQRRLISIVEAANVTAALGKFYQKTVSIVSSASLSLQKRQRRLTQITSAALVSFSFIRQLKLAFSISSQAVVGVAKRQLRSVQLAAVSLVAFTKQYFPAGQICHLAFDITSAAMLSLRKAQQRQMSINTSVVVSVAKRQLRAVQLAAVSLVTFTKRVIGPAQVYHLAVDIAASPIVSITKRQSRRLCIAAASLITQLLRPIIIILSGREAARVAFARILTDANLGVRVYDRMPYEGAEQRSVVLTVVSGVSRRPALSLLVSPFVRTLEEHYRLQVDCYHDDQVECEKLADAVEQVIMNEVDALATTYDIHQVKKSVDSDSAPADATARQARILLQFDFYIHRAVT
jgi:hypothetical protein